MIKNKLAFTLGEVLIALGVIGVVASLVLPQLIIGQKAATARAQFDTAYSLIAKAISDMDADNVSVHPDSYKVGQTLHPQIVKYIKVATNCGDYETAIKNASICINRNSGMLDGSGDNYKIYKKNSNTSINLMYFDDGAAVLTNGMLIALEQATYRESTINGKVYGRPILISVDINGKNKNPNRWGWDLFTFELTKDGIIPLGAESTHPDYSTTPENLCSDHNNSNLNGSTCAYFAATDNDYFKKLYKRH